jgi:aspartate/methionine/tyrosine aminotransferase
VFSDRLPRDLAANRLASAVESLRSAGRPFIDMTGSNPTRAGIVYPPALLASLVDARSLRYEPTPFGLLDTRVAVAADYRRHALEVSPAHVVLTASTSESYSMLFKLLCGAGDEVLVPRPSYPLFDYLTRMDLVVSKPYALEYHGRWTIDFDSLEGAITSRTRAVLVVSPNNPTGSLLAPPELDRLAAICADREIAIVADEVFVDYELEAGAVARAGRPLGAREALAFSLGGLSKSVGLPQLKLGWIVASGPPALVGEALQRLEVICDTYLSVATPVQVAAADILRRGAAVRDEISRRVRTNYAGLAQNVKHEPTCSRLTAEAGWYAVLQVPSYEPEEELVLGLLSREGVLIHPGYFFDFARESFLIVSLLTPEDSFQEGVHRVLEHFTRASRSGRA